MVHGVELSLDDEGIRLRRELLRAQSELLNAVERVHDLERKLGLHDHPSHEIFVNTYTGEAKAETRIYTSRT